jgi:DNA-binding CsgD family transcriptional regulator
VCTLAVMSPVAREELQVEIARLGATSRSLPAFRAAALERLRAVVPFDAAVFHALSPRVPLETGAVIGLDLAVLAATVPSWDAVAVTLGRLRELANVALVATDRMAFPLGSPQRALFEKEIGRPFRARALLVVHLVVRDAVRAVVMLVRRREPAFSDDEVAMLKRLAPTLAVADKAQESLDAAPSAVVPVRLACTDQRLTARQQEIVEHVALGHTNDEIASALGVSPNTLRNHLARVFAKLGASNRADLVRLAVLTPRATSPLSR